MYKTLILKIWDKHVFGRAAAQHAPCEWAVGLPICLLHIFHSGLSWRVWGSTEWQRVYGRLELVSLFMAPLWVRLARAGGFYAYRLLAEIRLAVVIGSFLQFSLVVGVFLPYSCGSFLQFFIAICCCFTLLSYGLPHAFLQFSLFVDLCSSWCFCMNDEWPHD